MNRMFLRIVLCLLALDLIIGLFAAVQLYRINHPVYSPTFMRMDDEFYPGKDPYDQHCPKPKISFSHKPNDFYVLHDRRGCLIKARLAPSPDFQDIPMEKTTTE